MERIGRLRVGTSGWVIENQNAYRQSDITGQAGKTGDNFGAAVAIGDIDGDTYLDVIVGVPGKTISGDVGAGEIAIFPRYYPGKVIQPSSPNVYDSFGNAVAVGNFDHGANSVRTNASSLTPNWTVRRLSTGRSGWR